jgi:hypothetical protein
MHSVWGGGGNLALALSDLSLLIELFLPLCCQIVQQAYSYDLRGALTAH